MVKSVWKNACYGLILLLVFLITISSHPSIMDINDVDNINSGTILSRYIILVFGALFLVSFDYFNINNYFYCRTLMVSWAFFVFIVLFSLITLSFYSSEKMLADARAIMICIVSVMIGWRLDLEEKGLYVLLLTFAVLVLYVGLMQVMVNIGSFEIHDQYESDNKNALGAMLAIGAVIFLFLGLNWEEIGRLRFVFLLGVLASIVVLLTIRARTATLTTGLMLVFILYERTKKRNMWVYFIIGIVGVVILYNLMPQTIKDYIYNSFFQNYEKGDVTTDRLRRNIDGIRFISQHVWVGSLNTYTQLAWIHNYVLDKLYKYGLIFAFPILSLYVFLLVNIIIKAVKSDNRNIYNIGYYLLLVPYIVSMAEPTFPFGPGTATIFCFIMLGVSLRNAFDGIEPEEEEIEEESSEDEEP